MSKVVNEYSSLKLKQLFLYELAFLREGKTIPASNLSLKGLAGRDLRVGKYLLADFFKRLPIDNDSIIISLYRESYYDAIEHQDTLVANEALDRYNTFLFLNGGNLDIYERYIKAHEAIAKDSIDIFNTVFHRIKLEFLKNENTPKKIDSSAVENLFQRAERYLVIPFQKGSLYSYKSFFYSACFDAKALSSKFSNNAISTLKDIPDYYAQYVVSGIEFNNAITLFDKKEYIEAISVFKRVLKQEKQLLYKMYAYDWIHKAYDSIGDYGNAYSYFKKVGEAKDSLSLLEHAREIKVIEDRYNFVQKERQLHELANEKKRVQSNFNTLVPFFAIALLLTLTTLFLYYKYRGRSKVLQQEKEETIRRIDELKKIVVKNHIVLKDKTKVYISDLIYIKAEDHYLKLYLSSENNHLVRGRIKEMKKQLPPNFIQCHRSYIINANFIKQTNRKSVIMIGGYIVPISRTFKNNL